MDGSGFVLFVSVLDNNSEDHDFCSSVLGVMRGELRVMVVARGMKIRRYSATQRILTRPRVDQRTNNVRLSWKKQST